MIKVRALTGAVLLGLLSVTLVAGCSRERIDWKSAEAADTPEAYNHFLERHPDSALAAQAHTRLTQLAEDKDWHLASTTDSAESYKGFLAQHPNGKWAEEARIRLENFSLDTNAAPNAAAASNDIAQPASPAAAPSAAPGDIAQPSKPVANTPPPKVAPNIDRAIKQAKASAEPPPPKQTITSGPPSKPTVTASTDNSGGYGIQLGAFSTRDAALSEWKKLQTAHDAELHGLFAHAVPVDVTSGKLFRLQSPVGDEARARAICSALTQKQTPCVVVLPPAKR